MKFSPDELYDLLRRNSREMSFRVAFSGGMDSHVLLHAMAALGRRYPVTVSVIHVNHGASPSADRWQEHCGQVCEQLGMHLDSIAIDAAPPRGESREAWFRKQRYHCFAEILQEGETLLTAHQADDQAETLLLQLLRGSGPAGLASMPLSRPLGRGRHLRPLLGYCRSDLEEYALANGLAWVEDESNLDRGYDRNYLRHEVMPVILRRWTGSLQTLGRAAGIQAETVVMLQQLAAADREEVLDPLTGALSIARLQGLPAARQRNLLRHWLTDAGFTPPDSRQLQAIIEQVILARNDAEPCLAWGETQVRRYRDRLFAMHALPEPEAGHRYPWDLDEPLSLPLGRLAARREHGHGLKPVGPRQQLEVRYRRGGESILLPGRQQHARLKNLFQQAGIPPWLRRFIPLVYSRDRLVSVAGLWYDREFVAGPDENGWSLEWSIPERADLGGQLAVFSRN